MEFIQDEFGDLILNTESYISEIDAISVKDHWESGELEQLLIEFPRTYDVLESVLQLQRSTNTQLIHFLFDTRILNSLQSQELYDYLVYNLSFDNYLF